MQVECAPPDTIVVNVDTFRQSGGGFIRLDLQNVAGSGAIRSVELRQAVQSVSRVNLNTLRIRHLLINSKSDFKILRLQYIKFKYP